MKTLQDLMFPIYALFKDVRKFNADSAASNTKFLGAVFICLVFNLLVNVFYFLFISKHFYIHARFIFENDLYILIPTSLLLAFFSLSGKQFEEDYDRVENDAYAISTVIIIYGMLIFFNVLLSLQLHSFYIN